MNILRTHIYALRLKGQVISHSFSSSWVCSELGSEVCNLTITPTQSAKDAPWSTEKESSRRNKRKNFLPRNIVEYAGSDEDEEHGRGGVQDHHHHHQQSPPDSGSMSSPADENSEGEGDEDVGGGGDTPLDLSEVQTSKYHIYILLGMSF